jgi:hypothetical protein
MNQDNDYLPFPDRRTKPRINCNYPAVIKGSDHSNNSYEEKARAVNLSASGVYLLSFKPIMVDSELSVVVAFPTGSLNLESSRLSTSGTVVRSEIQPDGAYGIAVKFQRYRFI